MDQSSQSGPKPPRSVVLLDANVLYSRVLSDYFVQLQATNVAAVKWSSQILDEVVRNKKKTATMRCHDPAELPSLLATAEDLRNHARTNYPESFVEPSEEDYARFADLYMPDPDDRHVVAAAVAARATYLCTSNTPDFPDPVMERVGIERIKPDALLHEHASRSPLAMVQAHQKVVGWTRGTTHRGLLERLRRAQAPATAETLERILKSLGNLDSRDDLARVYASALAERHRAQIGLLPPTSRRPGPEQLRVRPATGFRDRQRLDQQRGVGGR
ncbi:hypothetical protein GCM10011575_30350 [Microlunatus endophyticus]|uniref:PIN domain-containing protein n=1 Tax=Microlunatus endophyticus TaxID=1716077 RepID=A0A917SB99_9ACTN|nr:PIN domain-containing protein [Microlunatus endophyticus]GGL69714.1 hypothetical protein GCM10011575_30350 [Microlunatus endophyticus]